MKKKRAELIWGQEKNAHREIGSDKTHLWKKDGKRWRKWKTAVDPHKDKKSEFVFSVIFYLAHKIYCILTENIYIWVVYY